MRGRIFIGPDNGRAGFYREGRRLEGKIGDGDGRGFTLGYGLGRLSVACGRVGGVSLRCFWISLKNIVRGDQGNYDQDGNYDFLVHIYCSCFAAEELS